MLSFHDVGVYLGSASNLTTTDMSSRGNLISVTPMTKRRSTLGVEHSNPCTSIGSSCPSTDNTLQVPVIVTSYEDHEFKACVDSEDSL